MSQLAAYTVDPVFGCHRWTGKMNNLGRPVIWRGSSPQSVIRMVVGNIAADHVPDHLCRNIACVNREHLEVVTKHENERRKSMRYRMKRATCMRGHRLDETTRMLTPNGGVLCRRCHQDTRAVTP